MPRYIMMSLDLENGVSEENRQKFYAKLKEANWGKVPGVTTVWECRWANDQTSESMAAVVTNDLSVARVAAGYCAYHAVAMIGDSAPLVFKS